MFNLVIKNRNAFFKDATQQIYYFMRLPDGAVAARWVDIGVVGSFGGGVGLIVGVAASKDNIKRMSINFCISMAVE